MKQNLIIWFINFTYIFEIKIIVICLYCFVSTAKEVQLLWKKQNYYQKLFRLRQSWNLIHLNNFKENMEWDIKLMHKVINHINRTIIFLDLTKIENKIKSTNPFKMV